MKRLDFLDLTRLFGAQWGWNLASSVGCGFLISPCCHRPVTAVKKDLSDLFVKSFPNLCEAFPRLLFPNIVKYKLSYRCRFGYAATVALHDSVLEYESRAILIGHFFVSIIWTHMNCAKLVHRSVKGTVFIPLSFVICSQVRCVLWNKKYLFWGLLRNIFLTKKRHKSTKSFFLVLVLKMCIENVAFITKLTKEIKIF